MAIVSIGVDAVGGGAIGHQDVIMVLPATDLNMALRAAAFAEQRANAGLLVLVIPDDCRQGFVSIVNQAFRQTSSAWFGYMAQDAFAGRNWLSLALNRLGVTNAAFLGFNDGKWQGALASFGLARRDWAHTNYGGDYFYPGYFSHYADAEMTLLALGQGAYTYEPDSVLIELDWDKDVRQVNPADRLLYRERARNGFDGRVTHPQLLTAYA